MLNGKRPYMDFNIGYSFRMYWHYMADLHDPFLSVLIYDANGNVLTALPDQATYTKEWFSNLAGFIIYKSIRNEADGTATSDLAGKTGDLKLLYPY